MTLCAAALAFVSVAGADDELWIYWTVDSSDSGIEFYGANLYVVEDGASGRLVSTKWSTGAQTGTMTTGLTGENELKIAGATTPSKPCDMCLLSDISGVGIGAQFYVELLGANQETVGFWTGKYMSMEELTGIHRALAGMVSGLQTKEPFHHDHGGQWVADQFSTVPEPSGGLLTLVGLALLALRRRKTS